MRACGGVDEEIKSEKSEIIILGEVREWSACEYARDAAQLGYKKTIIVMGIFLRRETVCNTLPTY